MSQKRFFLQCILYHSPPCSLVSNRIGSSPESCQAVLLLVQWLSVHTGYHWAVYCSSLLHPFGSCSITIFKSQEPLMELNPGFLGTYSHSPEDQPPSWDIAMEVAPRSPAEILTDFSPPFLDGLLSIFCSCPLKTSPSQLLFLKLA